jgi:hypothetical protein
VEAWVTSRRTGSKSDHAKVQFRSQREHVRLRIDPGRARQHGKLRAPGDARRCRPDGRLTAAACAATIEKAKADDPKILQKRLRDAEREIDRLKSEQKVEVQVETVKVEVPVPFVPDDVAGFFPEMIGRLNEMWDRVKDVPTTVPQPEPPAPTVPVQRSRPAPVAAPQPARPILNLLDREITSSDRAALIALVQHWQDRGTPLETRLLAAKIGKSPRKSTIRNILSRLRQAGLAEGSATVVPTAAGIAEVAGEVTTLPSGEELVNYWTGKVGGDAGVLKTIIDAHPRELSTVELCDRTGYDPDKSTIRNVLSRLRTHGLVGPGRALDPHFAEAIGR